MTRRGYVIGTNGRVEARDSRLVSRGNPRQQLETVDSVNGETQTFKHIMLMQTPNTTPTHTHLETSSSQWIFPLETLRVTPSATSSQMTLEKELYDRARGIEFLYRLGASLQLYVIALASLLLVFSLAYRTTSALFTAATWYHRFYMRFSMEDFHRQVRHSSTSRRIP